MWIAGINGKENRLASVLIRSIFGGRKGSVRTRESPANRALQLDSFTPQLLRQCFINHAGRLADPGAPESQKTVKRKI